MTKTAKQSAKPTAKKFPETPPDDAPLIDWALWHHGHGEAINGYWLTPIRPGEKAAYKKDWSKKPLKSRAAVERHWKANPSDNIGLVPRPGNFWLDADDLDVLQKAEKKHGVIPRTYAQWSLNGSLHFLFQGDVTTSPPVYFAGKKLGEIRGALSGQCVAAGSRGTTRQGEPGTWEIEEVAPPIVAPDWVFDLIKGSGKATLKDARREYGEPIDWDREQAEYLVEIVERGKLIKDYEGPFLEGQRDNLAFQLFALGKNRMIHPDVLLEAVLRAGIDGGLDDDTVEQKMQSAYHDGNTQDSYGSKVMAYWLPNHVFKPYVDGKPIDRPPADPVEWKAANPDRLPKAFPGDPEPKPEGEGDRGSDPDARYRQLVRHFGSVLAASGERDRRATRFGDIPSFDERQGADWAIDKWLLKNATNALYGESEAFKTYITINMLLCVATGASWGAYEGFEGYPVDGPRDVILFAGEGYDDMLDRIDAAIRGGGFDRELVKKHLIVVSDVYTLNRADGLAGMADEIETLDAHPAIIAIDTYNLALDGNEDDSDEAKRALRGLRALAIMFDAAGLVLHHPGWSDTKRPRGSSAFRANSDIMILCERAPGDVNMASLTQYKNRSADKAKYRAALVGKSISLGVDSDTGTPTSNLSFAPIVPSAIPSTRDDAGLAKIGTSNDYAEALAEGLLAAPAGKNIVGATEATNLARQWMEDQDGLKLPSASAYRKWLYAVLNATRKEPAYTAAYLIHNRDPLKFSHPDRIIGIEREPRASTSQLPRDQQD